MSKNSKIFIVFTAIILFYSMSWLTFREQYGQVYLLAIQPLFWLSLALFCNYFIFNNFRNYFAYKKFLIILFITAGLMFVVFNFLLGIAISGFAKNPYDNTIYGLFMNFWQMGSIIIAMEIVRSSLVNATSRNHEKLMNANIIIIFALISINYLNLTNEMADMLGLVRFVGMTLIPLMILNLLLTIAAKKGGPLPGIYYQLIINFSVWVAPILPNHKWLIVSLLGSIIPFITLMVLDNKVKTKEQNVSRRMLEETDPKKWTLTFIAIGITVAFFLGLTPVYPINIMTQSMEPIINVGDAVIIRRGHYEDLKISDVIQYQKADYTVIHRIVQIDKKDGIMYIHTKGDNNKDVDSITITDKNYLGKVIMVIPKVGIPNIWLKNTIAKLNE